MVHLLTFAEPSTRVVVPWPLRYLGSLAYIMACLRGFIRYRPCCGSLECTGVQQPERVLNEKGSLIPSRKLFSLCIVFSTTD
jgi:hypothetical protein